MSKLANPIHFFDERGRSTLSFDHLCEKLRETEEENERLKRMLRAVQKRDAMLESDKFPSFQ